NVASAFQLPEFLTSIEVVAAHVLPTIQDQLATLVGDVNRWRAPRRHFLARRAPDLFARLDVERRDEAALLRIALHVDAALVNHRRTGPAPLRVGHAKEAGVQHAKVLLPNQLAIDGEDVQAFRAM